MVPKMMTGAEVGDLLRVSGETVYRLAAQGELPAQKIGRVWRFPRHPIDELALQKLNPVPGNTVADENAVPADARE